MICCESGNSRHNGLCFYTAHRIINLRGGNRMDKEKTGKMIKEARVSKGYTQAELGCLLGVSNKAVSRWEKGESFPDVGVLENLSVTLDIGIEELITGDDGTKENAINELIRVVKIQNKQKRRMVIDVILYALYAAFLLILAYYASFFTEFGYSYKFAYFLAIVTVLMLFVSNGKKRLGDNSELRQKAIFPALALFSMIYATTLMFITLSVVGKGRTPFGMELAKVGPFLDYQLLAVFIINFAIAFITIFMSIKNGKSIPVAPFIALPAVNLALQYRSMLYNMESLTHAIGWVKVITLTIYALLFMALVVFKANNMRNMVIRHKENGAL